MSAARRAVSKARKQTQPSNASAGDIPQARASASLIAHLQDTLQSSIDGLAGVERRRVLASDGWFRGGKLFTLVSKQGRIVVKLSDEASQDELLALEGATAWKIGAKAPMRSWIELPERLHDDTDAIGVWVKRAWSLAPSSGAAKKPEKKRTVAGGTKAGPRAPARKATKGR